MTSFDKIIIAFMIAWALLPAAVLLIHNIRQPARRALPIRFWLSWGNVFLLSLLALVRNHPTFYHAYIISVAAGFFLWLLVLVWDFWKVTSRVGKNHDINVMASQRGR